MRKLLGVMFIASMSAMLAVGCGEATPDSVPFKPVETSQFDEMKNAMTKNITKKGKVKEVSAPNSAKKGS